MGWKKAMALDQIDNSQKIVTKIRNIQSEVRAIIGWIGKFDYTIQLLLYSVNNTFDCINKLFKCVFVCICTKEGSMSPYGRQIS